MALYKVTTKGSCNSAGYSIVPGMSVEINSLGAIISVNAVANQVQSAFMAKYGIDLRAMNCLNMGYFKIEKV